MKKVVSLLLVAVMLSALAFTLVGCGAPEDDGAEIDIYLGNEIYDFDPTDYYVDSNAEQVMSLLFEPLFSYQNGKLGFACAKDYKIDKEKREIVITLRETYWSNNTRVKASDFVYAWSERLLNPNNANPAAILLFDIENAAAIKGGMMSPAELKAEATGVDELTITYREGADPDQLLVNLASVATAPIRQSDVETVITYWSKLITNVVTNGPFKVTRYSTVNNELILSRNKGYHQDFETVNYVGQVTPGQLVGLTTALGDKIELSYEDIENKTRFYLQDASLADRAKYKDKATVVDDTSVYTYVFNTENPLFAIPEVRVALSMAIDREAIVNAVVFGKAADGFVPDISGGSGASLISTKADTAAANALLRRISLDGLDKNIELTIANNEQSVKIAELVKASWESLDAGFKVTVKAVDVIETVITSEGDEEGDEIRFLDSAIQAAVKDASFGVRNFDVIAVDWQTYTSDAFVALASLTSEMNGCGKVLPYGSARPSISAWSDSEYDYLITTAYASEGSERAACLEQAEAYLCEKMPVMPIMFNQSFAFISSELSGVKYDSFGNVIFTKVEQKNYKDYLVEEE
ncbi:MAG: hypothetical protein IKC87_01505 [Clostridia bacterium]|nr:hypothetical protein [Clostridia bacterium]